MNPSVSDPASRVLLQHQAAGTGQCAGVRGGQSLGPVIQVHIQFIPKERGSKWHMIFILRSSSGTGAQACGLEQQLTCTPHLVPGGEQGLQSPGGVSFPQKEGPGHRGELDWALMVSVSGPSTGRLYDRLTRGLWPLGL